MKHKKLFSFLIIIMIIIIAGCDNSNTFSSKSDTESYNKPSSSTILVSRKESSKPDISGRGELWTDKKLKVGLRTIGPISSWQVANSADILRAAEDWNVELAFSDGTGGQEIEITALQSYIEYNKNVIGFAPIKENGYEEILREVKEAGIPVILIDRAVNCADESLWMSYIVNDRYKQGQMSGEWLINYLKAQGEIDKDIRIVELNGPEESYVTRDIKNGFNDVIKAHKNMEIIESRYGDYTYLTAKDDIKAILAETKDIDVLFCHYDDMTLGAIEAIEEAGLVPGEDIIIISIMGTNAALEAIVDGKIACSVECNPLMGDLFMEACVRLANGEEIEREIHPVDRVFDITNAQAELDARKANGYGY